MSENSTKIAVLENAFKIHLSDCKSRDERIEKEKMKQEKRTNEILEKILSKLDVFDEYKTRQETTVSNFKWLSTIGGGAGFVAFIKTFFE
jgi:hypothetical protein